MKTIFFYIKFPFKVFELLILCIFSEAYMFSGPNFEIKFMTE